MKTQILLTIGFTLFVQAQLASKNKFLQIENNMQATKEKDYFKKICLLDQKCNDCSYGFMCNFSKERIDKEKCYQDCLDYEDTYYFVPEKEVENALEQQKDEEITQSTTTVEEIELIPYKELCTGKKLCSKCSVNQKCNQVADKQKQEKCFGMCFDHRKNFLHFRS